MSHEQIEQAILDWMAYGVPRSIAVQYVSAFDGLTKGAKK